MYPYLATSTDRLMWTLLGNCSPVVGGGACLSGTASRKSNGTLFTTSLSAPGCSSHGTPLMLSTGTPSPESSSATLRMLLAKTAPCGVPTTAISDSSLIPKKSPHATLIRLGPFSWTAPSKIPFQTTAHIDVAFLSDRRLCDSLSFHRFHGEIC